MAQASKFANAYTINVTDLRSTTQDSNSTQKTSTAYSRIIKTITSPDQVFRITQAVTCATTTARVMYNVIYNPETTISSQLPLIFDAFTHGVQSLITKDSPTVYKFIASGLNITRVIQNSFALSQRSVLPQDIPLIKLDIVQHGLSVVYNLVNTPDKKVKKSE